ncbi:MAG: primosomal protein N' [Lachnospiraceae bacterium]|nr:primosomal protein N' [Lachnospiraceae bacterium]
MSELFADIIIDISTERLDRTFQYRVPDELKDRISCGALVSIPFGKGNRIINGYIVNLTDTPEFDPEKTKDIAGIKDDNSEKAVGRLLSLAAWMKHHYGGTLIQSLKVVLPKKTPVKQVEQKTIRLTADKKTIDVYVKEFEKKHQVARLRLMYALMEAGAMDKKLITSKLAVGTPVIKALENRGLVKVDTTVSYRNPLVFEPHEKKINTLSIDQKSVIDGILSGYEKGDLRPALIHGVTGSGKTEVYIDIIEGMVKKGYQAIMLIPEIALTYQTVMRFSARFKDRVSFIHSKLSPGERYDQFLRARSGELDVMIGPRSALFTPFPNLGIIIMDEEHETSYKSEQMPKYHAREAAEKLASLWGAAFVMGSATPSVESYLKAMNGTYNLYEMPERITGGELPVVYTVDLRKELANGNRSIFSERLRSLMEDRLSHREQIMLFLNRRGFSSFVSCRKCGFVYKCPHCDVSLSLHGDKKLHCHYCGYTAPMEPLCPECASRYIGGMKAGTEQVEKLVHREFPGVRTLRMDMDTTRKKGDYDRILSSFANEEADVLIGTQMIVKGHDFPNVTLMGILAADMSLYSGDYRAAERTFELLTQAAGRAGRGGILPEGSGVRRSMGEVVIQTYSPDNYAVVAASQQNYQKFFEEESFYRKIGSYPPEGHLLQILIEDKNLKNASSASEDIARICRKSEEVQVIGPADAAIARINDVYRRVVYVKCSDYEKLACIKDEIELDRMQREDFRGHIEFDFDP